MRFVSAAAVSLEAFAAAFTAAFEGYPVPVVVDSVWLARRARYEQHDLQNSLVAFDGAEAVGMAVLAARGERGWVGGFGVVPRWRGRGLARRLMSELVGRARSSGLRRLSLEVLRGNTAALRLYERAGMHVTRDLLVMERPAEWRAAATPRGAAPREAPAAELLEHFTRLHPEPPAWQREPASLWAAKLSGLYLGPRSRPRAYALVKHTAEDEAHLSDLAAADARQARAVCAALGRLGRTLRIQNEPERSPYVAPLLEHGFVEVLRQHEMTMEL
ncbi:MAG TPA: GNAT family N-acetyltransferase [Pyrinomonadaceae bacterium]